MGKAAESAIAELRAGNEAFVRSLDPGRQAALLERLARGQAPPAAILSCSDSRTAPDIIFNQNLGGIFSIRVAGNVATQVERASLEFAAAMLHCPLIVVMGHSDCGAVRAALELTKGASFPGDIQALAALISPAAHETKNQPGDWLYNATVHNVRTSVRSLEASSVLSQLLNSDALKIVGAYYDLTSGKVVFL